MVDGSLYYDDELLAQVDWVVASLHVGQRQDSERATSRMLAAIENPYVDVLAHPSGRLLGRREGYDFDMGAVAEAAARTGTFLEINCGPARLDLRPAHAKAAIEAGVKLVISTDAHRTTSFAPPDARRRRWRGGPGRPPATSRTPCPGPSSTASASSADLRSTARTAYS